MTVLVYMTAENEQAARRIGTALVEARLAACVNILGKVDSLFWWNTSVQSETEVAFIAKSTEANLRELTECVKALHTYEVPCVVALPIIGGNEEFIQWVQDETKES